MHVTIGAVDAKVAIYSIKAMYAVDAVEAIGAIRAIITVETTEAIVQPMRSIRAMLVRRPIR